MYMHAHVYTQLQKLLISTSHRATLSVVDCVGNEFDHKVKQWQDQMIKQGAAVEIFYLSVLIFITVLLFL